MTIRLETNKAIIYSSRYKTDKSGWIYQKTGERGNGRDADDNVYVCLTSTVSTDDKPKNVICNN